MRRLPECDLVAAGFPCQDLSQAGRTAGIGGRNSGLVKRVFELLEQAEHPPEWLLLENVPFMLQLERGDAMRYLARRLGELGYRWAYRVVDARAFGLPQRRQRVILLASQTADPREILFHGDRGRAGDARLSRSRLRVLLDRGHSRSRLGGRRRTDAEGRVDDRDPVAASDLDAGRADRAPPTFVTLSGCRGLRPTGPQPAGELGRRGERHRWKLVGNAVSVPVAEWVGRRLRNPRPYDESLHERARRELAVAAGGLGRRVGTFTVSPSRAWPVQSSVPEPRELPALPRETAVRAGCRGIPSPDVPSPRCASRTVLLEAVEAHLQLDARRSRRLDDARLRP